MNFDELGLSQEEINQLVNSQNQDQYSLNSPSFVQGKPKDEILGKWEVDFKEQVQDLIMTLKGYSYDTENKKYVINIDLIPELNSRGINTILAVLQVHLNKGIALGNNDGKEINNIMRSLTTRLGEDLYCNQHIYGIKSSQKLYLILHYVETFALSILNRSKGGWESNNRITMVSITASQGALNQDPNQKKGFMSRLWGGD